MSKYKYHKDGTQPSNNEIFVFGSNKAGRHGAGAALAAYKHFGAVLGDGYGLRGNSYALPTVDEHIVPLTLEEIKLHVKLFKLFATQNPDLNFFMTRIACVLAGHSDETIAPLFFASPNNINFPDNWKEFLEISILHHSV